MFRPDIWMNKEHINFLLDDGGLGDNIARIPSIKYILKNYPHVIPHIWVPDYAVSLYKHFLPDALVSSFDKGKTDYNDKWAGRKTSSREHTNMKTHLVDNAFHILVDKAVEIEDKNYPQLELDKIDISKFKLPGKYVIITTGYTVSVRAMKAETVNALSDFVLSKGYTPVYLGSKIARVGGHHKENIVGNFSQEIDYNKGIDLINQTTLLQVGKIIAGAKCLIGLDNGLMHIAGCTETAIVGGFTTVEPKYRMPYRHNELGWNFYPVIPDSGVSCRFCQSNWEFVFNHDFRLCYYKEKGYDTKILCTQNLKVDKYIQFLEKIL